MIFAVAFVALVALSAAAVVPPHQQRVGRQHGSAPLIIDAAELPQTESEHRDHFHRLMSAYEREYTIDSDEYHTRYGHFRANVQRISDLQAMSKRARFGLNLFFDVSEEEFKSYRMPPIDVEKVRREEAQANPGTVARSCIGGGASKKRSVADDEARLAALPAEFDWRTHHGVLTPVKNQAQCGSCWAFSATETLESAWALAGHPLVELAPQQIVDCSRACTMLDGMKVCDQGCGGGFPAEAITSLMKEGGQEPESKYPYQGVNGQCQFNKADVVAVPKNFTCLSGPQTASEVDMMEGLVKQPLSVCVDAASWQFYYDGVIENEGGLICDTTSLDHAVQMVAYGTARDLFGSMMKVVVIRNSWTASWGLDGYVLLARNGENTCGYRNAVLMVDV